MDRILNIFMVPFVPFIVLKTTVSISRFQRKNRFEKRPTLGWDIWENPFLAGGLVWCAVLKYIFANISAQSGSFFKPIFALKPWDWDGHFEYNKKVQTKKNKIKKFVLICQKLPQKPKIAEKLDLIWQNGYSLKYL